MYLQYFCIFAHLKRKGKAVVMDNIKEFLIQFSGLKLGKHQFEFLVNDTFFKHFDFEEFNHSEIKVKLLLEKKSTMLELHFSHAGTVNVPCDLTNEDFDLPIKGKLNLIVKFGDEFNDENESFIILPHGEFQVNIAQYVYEMIVLSVPTKKTHPGIKDGTLQSDALVQLEKYAPTEREIKETEDIDPRWENLKKLLTDKK